jgi:putative DNA primase/helicase
MNQIEEGTQENGGSARPRRAATTKHVARGRETPAKDAIDAPASPDSPQPKRTGAKPRGRKKSPAIDMQAPGPGGAPASKGWHEGPDKPAGGGIGQKPVPFGTHSRAKDKDDDASATANVSQETSTAPATWAGRLRQLQRATGYAVEKAGAVWSRFNTVPEALTRTQSHNEPTTAPAPPREFKHATPADGDGERLPLQPREAETSGIVVSLANRYLIANDKYYFRDRGQSLAFEDLGRRIATTHNDPDVAHSMVDLAQAKGWNSLKVKGSDVFKSEVWLCAAQRGIDVAGYRPKTADKARLAAIEAERGTVKPNIIEKNTQLDLPLAETAREPKPEPAPTDTQSAPQLSKRQLQSLDVLKTLLRDRGDSEQAVELTAAVAAEQMLSRRSYIGKLLEHGSAPFEYNKEERDSYYVVLDTPRGTKTIWGVDLQRALEEVRIEPGTDIMLSQIGQRGVTVPVIERDADGKATGTGYLDTNRNEWEISTIDSMRDMAASRLEARQVGADSPELPGLVSLGIPQPSPEPAQSREKHLERESPTR